MASHGQGGGWAARRPFLEGDEHVREDDLNGGWYWDRGEAAAPYHGVVIKDHRQGRVSAYRWRIEDPIPFGREIRVGIEHGPRNDVEADYSSVAYFYQREPHAPFPALPADPAALLATPPPPMKKIPGALDAEALLPVARSADGEIEVAYLGSFDGPWSDADLLLWSPRVPGARLDLALPVGRGRYRVTAHLARSDNCGTVQAWVGPSRLGPPVDLYREGPAVEPTGPLSLGTVDLAGPTPPVLTFELVGKPAGVAATVIGIDALVLDPAP